jgi:hypothetical protein
MYNVNKFVELLNNLLEYFRDSTILNDALSFFSPTANSIDHPTLILNRQWYHVALYTVLEKGTSTWRSKGYKKSSIQQGEKLTSPRGG